MPVLVDPTSVVDVTVQAGPATACMYGPTSRERFEDVDPSELG